MSTYIEEKDYTQKFSLSLWKRILNYAPEYKKELVKLCVWMGVTALIDVLFPLLTRYAIDVFIGEMTTEGMGLFIGLYILLLLVQVVAIYRFLYIGGKIETGACYVIRQKAFKKLAVAACGLAALTPPPTTYCEVSPTIRLASGLTRHASSA